MKSSMLNFSHTCIEDKRSDRVACFDQCCEVDSKSPPYVTHVRTTVRRNLLTTLFVSGEATVFTSDSLSHNTPHEVAAKVTKGQAEKVVYLEDVSFFQELNVH